MMQERQKPRERYEKMLNYNVLCGCARREGTSLAVRTGMIYRKPRERKTETKKDGRRKCHERQVIYTWKITKRSTKGKSGG